MGPPTHIPHPLNGMAHLIFGLTHTHHKMGSGISLSKNPDSVFETTPVSLPFVRPLDAPAPVSIEQLSRCQINSHTNFVGAGRPECLEVLPAEYGWGNEEGNGGIKAGPQL